jgi:isoamylase
MREKTDKKISPGQSEVPGAVISAGGVNFSLYSAHAKEAYLLLFDDSQGEPTDIVKLKKGRKHFWSIFVHGVSAGQLYGFKVEGPYNPSEGMRFNPHKLLIDPYAKALTDECRNHNDLLYGYDFSSPDKDKTMDRRDNSECAPRSVVVDDAFDWDNDAKPNIPFEKLIIYETHLKGFTAHKSSKAEFPGTYLGFIEKIPYLKKLGVNAVELMPIHQFYKRDELIEKGLSEYWGYNSIGFFAPEVSYCSRQTYDSPVKEFKTLVKELHKAGIEVILDVVYNHTGEGDQLGPTLCFKGIDNSSYYALKGDKKDPYRYYVNITGCGNTFNVENPIAMRLVLDSLRYWAQVMRVDGFRFDLASALARVHGAFSKESLFLKAIARDPVLKNVKIIAEPWDLSTYQVGNFPPGWSEWNGKFRDTVRKFIKGLPGQARDLSLRVTGSPDLYGNDGRSPYNSINFITCHDGFTLNDLYSYDSKHNEANGEGNRDGSNDNNSFNCGHEGETDDAAIVETRNRLMRNAFCCLFISTGTPMLSGGDEFCRSQKGNNNPYCQDNEITWFNWTLTEKNKTMVEFVRKAIAFRNRYTILQKRRFFTGHDTDNDSVPDIQWFDKTGGKVNWDESNLKTFSCQLDGSEEPSPLGNYHLFFILNADTQKQDVKIPQHQAMFWYRVIDTYRGGEDNFLEPGKEVPIDDQESYSIEGGSFAALLGR